MHRFTYEYLVIPLALMLLLGAYWFDHSRRDASLQVFMHEEGLLLEKHKQDLLAQLERPMQQMSILNASLLGLAETGRWREVEAILKLLASTNPAYFQVRYLDMQGRERVRVDQVTPGNVQTVPADQLQSKHDRYYTQKMLALPEGHFYLSQLDLNVENGQIQLPFQPTIRVGMRLGRPDQAGSGFLMINMNGHLLLNVLTSSDDAHLFKTYMVNGQGDWLSAPEPGLAWRVQLGHEQNLQSFADAPQKLVLNPAHAEVMHARGKEGGYWLLKSLKADFGPRYVVDITEPWILLNYVTEETMNQHLPAFERMQVLILGIPLAALVLFITLRSLRISRAAEETARLESEQIQKQSERLEQSVSHRTRQLREALAFIETLADHLPVMIASWDRNLKCQFANRSIVEWFGLTKSEAIGKSLADCIGEDRFISRQEILQSVFQGEARQTEALYPRKGGTEVRLCRVDYLPLENGERGFITVLLDITEQRKAEQVLRDRTLEAEQAAEAKQSFLANMSHEVRTPMNAILGMIQLLLDTNMSDLQRNYALKAYQASGSLLRILNEILDLSKLEAGGVILEHVPFDLDELVERSVDLFALQAEQKGLSLEVDVDPAVPQRLMGDPLRLGQVLSNLMGNAIKFTEQGEVSLSIELVSETERSVTLALVLADTGIGMTDEQLGHIFKPFSQADHSTARRYGGTGLGLSISRALAEYMGGELSVESQQGAGSVFSFKVELEIAPETCRYRDENLSNTRVYMQPELHGQCKQEAWVLEWLETWRVDVQPYPQDWAEALSGDKPHSILIVMGSDQLAFESVKAALTFNARYPQGQQPLRPIIVLPAGHVSPNLPALNDNAPCYLSAPLTPARLLAALKGEAANRIDPAPVPLAASGRLPPLHLLVVDDLPVNREVVVQLLKKIGVSSDEAESGEQALDAISKRHYDAILMDIYMDGMTGYEAVEAMPEGAPPVIGLSASVLDRDREAAARAGMVDYLGKPVVLKELQAALEKLFAAHEADVPAQTNVITPVSAESSVFTEPDDVDWLFTLPAFVDRESVRHQFGDEEELYLACLESFAASMGKLTEALGESLHSASGEAVAAVLHRIKGGAATVANRELELACRAAEDELEARGDTQVAQPVLELMQRQQAELAKISFDAVTG